MISYNYVARPAVKVGQHGGGMRYLYHRSSMYLEYGIKYDRIIYNPCINTIERTSV